MAEQLEAPERGAGLLRLAVAGTGLLVGTSVAAALLPDTFARVHAVLSGLLFTVGTAAFLWAYALGVSRSRVDVVSISGLFFLAGDTAPASVRRQFRVAAVVEVVAVLGAAFARPYSEVAFGVLAPIFAMGLMGVWGGRYGSFPAQPPKPGRGTGALDDPAEDEPEGAAPGSAGAGPPG